MAYDPKTDKKLNELVTKIKAREENQDDASLDKLYDELEKELSGSDPERLSAAIGQLAGTQSTRGQKTLESLTKARDDAQASAQRAEQVKGTLMDVGKTALNMSTGSTGVLPAQSGPAGNLLASLTSGVTGGRT